ncbi:substrate-binding domain-containing protein, partial [Rhizobiaceae sp. 2RAB30]
LFECHRAAIAVPRRMGISGFNDLDMMRVAFPSLTSVRTPRYEIGHRSARMALDRLAGKEVAAPVLDLGFELQARESTRRR